MCELAGVDQEHTTPEHSKLFQKNQTLELIKHTRPTNDAAYERNASADQPSSDHLVHCHGIHRWQSPKSPQGLSSALSPSCAQPTELLPTQTQAALCHAV